MGGRGVWRTLSNISDEDLLRFKSVNYFDEKPPSRMFSYIWLSTLYKEIGAKRATISSFPEVYIGNGVLKICSKFTIELPCPSVISIKLQSNFIEIILRHGCSPANLLHIFRIFFLIIPLTGYFCFFWNSFRNELHIPLAYFSHI